MQTDEKQSVYFEPRHGQAQRKAHTLLQKENKVGAIVGVKTSRSKIYFWSLGIRRAASTQRVATDPTRDVRHDGDTPPREGHTLDNPRGSYVVVFY